MEDFKSEKKNTTSLSFRDLVYKYIRFFPLYVLFILLAFLGAWLYLRYTQEKYNAAGKIIINTGSTGDKVDELMSGNAKDRNLLSEIEVLRSRPLLTRVAKKLNLQFSYTAIGKVKDMNAYRKTPFIIQPVQFADSSLGFNLNVEIANTSQFKLNEENTLYSFGQNFKIPQGVFKLVKQSEPGIGAKYILNYAPAEAVGAGLAGTLQIAPQIPGTGMLLVVSESTNPFLAADVVNAVMTEYNNLSVEQNNTSINSKIVFADQRLNDLQNDIDSLQRRLVAFQKSNELINAETQIQSHLGVAEEQEEVAQTQMIALASLNQIEGYLRSKANEHQNIVLPSSLGIGDATLNSMITRYNEQQIARKALIDANVPEGNMKVKQMDESIDVARRGILESISLLKRNYQKMGGIASARKSQNKGKALNLPEKANEQRELERELESKQQTFDMINNNREMSALGRSGATGGGKIIEKAEPNPSPIKPDPKTIKLAAILLGLTLPTAIIFLKEILNDRVNTRGDIEKNTNAPILGEIGHSPLESTLVVNNANRTLIAEQFRIIRSNLQYITGKKDKVVMLVTSSFSGEGKSFISTNMGAVLALTDKKTVILEFDLRKPRIIANLGLGIKKGISNYMIGNATLDDILVPVAGQENLYILPCGPIPPNPAELLLSEKISELFTRLKERFDYVVIDTAPVGMVSDALTLGKYADCTLYVTRQGRTFKKQIGLVEEIYSQSKLPHLSIVLNDVKMPTGGGYYGNYGYGYYGYGEKSKDGYYDVPVAQKSIRKKLANAMNPASWFSKK